MAEYQRYISNRVLIDQLPLTYKLISRHFNVHINDAKKILFTFYDSNKDRCIPTYLITGEMEGKTQIRLTSDFKATDDFESVSSTQIFSVKPAGSAISLNDIITTVNDDISKYTPTTENCEKWGLIRCPEAVIQEETPAIVASKKHSIEKEEPRPAKKQTTTQPKKDPFAISSLYTSRKKQKENEQKPKQEAEPLAKPKYQYVSRKASQENKATLETRRKPGMKKIDSDLAALFDDDDDDFKDETFEDGKKEPTPVEVESIEETPVAEMAAPITSVDVKAPDTEVDTEDTQDRQEEPEIDEDGYIITKKPATKAAPAKRTPSAKTAASSKLSEPPANKQKKQTSLMNFFGKR